MLASRTRLPWKTCTTPVADSANSREAILVPGYLEITTRGINQPERPIADITVPIQTLRIPRTRHNRIRRDEPPHARVESAARQRAGVVVIQRPQPRLAPVAGEARPEPVEGRRSVSRLPVLARDAPQEKDGAVTIELGLIAIAVRRCPGSLPPLRSPSPWSPLAGSPIRPTNRTRPRLCHSRLHTKHTIDDREVIAGCTSGGCFRRRIPHSSPTSASTNGMSSPMSTGFDIFTAPDRRLHP